MTVQPDIPSEGGDEETTRVTAADMLRVKGKAVAAAKPEKPKEAWEQWVQDYEWPDYRDD